LAACRPRQEPRWVTGCPWDNRGERARTCPDYSGTAPSLSRSGQLHRQQSQEHIPDHQRLVLPRISRQRV
jgi:hypothetical protein